MKLLKKLLKWLKKKFIPIQSYKNDGLVTNNATVTVREFEDGIDFIDVWLMNILHLHSLPASFHSILRELLMMGDFNNIVSLSSSNRKLLYERLGMANSTFNNAVVSLIKVGILERVVIGEKTANGVYRLNSNFFGDGKFENIVSLRLEIKYSNEGRVFLTEVKKSSS